MKVNNMRIDFVSASTLSYSVAFIQFYETQILAFGKRLKTRKPLYTVFPLKKNVQDVPASAVLLSRPSQTDIRYR